MIFRVSVVLARVIPKVDGAIDWTVIYPVDSDIRLLNNWGMDRTFRQCLAFQQHLRSSASVSRTSCISLVRYVSPLVVNGVDCGMLASRYSSFYLLLQQKHIPKYVSCFAFARNGDVYTGDTDGSICVWPEGLCCYYQLYKKLKLKPQL